MNIKRFPGYRLEKLIVHETVAFFADTNCMLIRPDTGTTLSMCNQLGERFEKRQLTDDLIFLLVQRALADYDKSRPLVDCQKCVLPDFFLIDLTKACNMSCTYCFRDLDAHCERVADDQLSRICNSLIAYWNAHPHIHLSIQAWGGEPLLELSSIVEIRRIFNEAGLHPKITVESNGTLITPEAAQALCNNNIEMGISIDGNALVHDLQRPLVDGQASLHLVERGISNLREAGCDDFGTITVVTKNTVAHLHEILQFFTEKLHLCRIKMNLMRKNEQNSDLAVSLEEIDSYVEVLISHLYDLYRQRISLVEQNISQRLSNLLFRPNNNICNAYGCHGGYRMLSIDIDGHVYPCELSDYPNYCLGVAGTSDFTDMVRTAIASDHEYFAEKQLNECKGCPWLYFCGGGCRSSVKYDGKSPTEIDHTECIFNKSLYPRLVEILLTDSSFGQYLLNGEI